MIRRAVLVTGGALVGVLSVGCAGQFDTSHDDATEWTNSIVTSTMQMSGPDLGTNTPATPPDATESITGNDGVPARDSGGDSGQTPECTATDLKPHLGGARIAGDTRYRPLVFTNVSASSCRLQGFPGVSFVAGADGHQVGSPAARNGNAGAPVVLRTGLTASALLRLTDSDSYAPKACAPVPVFGYRVYPPDSTTGMFVPTSGIEACSGTVLPSPQLLVSSISVVSVATG